MKRVPITLMIACLVATALHGGEKVLVASVENPGRFERKSETIAVRLKDIKEKLKRAGIDRLSVSDEATGGILVSQTTADELLFQYDFTPGERRRFLIRESGEKPPTAPSLVDGRFVRPREDYAWENDRIAFRMYGPALAADVNNGIDVWTKRVRHLIVAKWYKESEGSPPGKDTYHQDRGEGADFFAVGQSLGAGGSGIWFEGKVCQPGVFSSYATVCNGPIRLTFELTYTGWNIGGHKFTERKRISLDAGQNLNRIDVSFVGLPAEDAPRIACGLVKRSNTSVADGEGNTWMSLWGLTNSDSVNGFLGSGIVLPPATRATRTEDSLQYLLISAAIPRGKFTYYTGAGWTRSGDFMTASDWNAYLAGFVRRLEVPLKLSIAVKK